MKSELKLSNSDAKKVVETATSFLTDVEFCGLKYNVRLDEVYSSILAHPLERIFCNILRIEYPDVDHNGRPGKHDVLLPKTNYELEVKTTQSLKSLQIDVDTWVNNDKKNVIYFIRKPKTIDQWIVILFEGLTRDMFGQKGTASNKSKGKATMKKWKAWKKAHILLGDVKITNKTYKKYGQRLCFSPKYERVEIK